MPRIIRKIFPITPSIINTIPTDLLCLGLNKDIIMPMTDMAAISSLIMLFFCLVRQLLLRYIFPY